MNVNFGPVIFALFISLLLIIFCSFFAARLAQLKGRSKAWGFLGFLFNIVGLIIVCYLPSKRKDGIQTNPIAHAFSKMPSMSRKTIGFTVGLAIAAVLTIVAYDNIPKIIENYKYSKQISEYSDVVQDQPKLINATPKEIFVGSNSTYMTSDNGDLYCWGKQFSNQLENEERGIIYKNAKKADSNDDICFVLTTDGKLYGMGDNSNSLLPSELEYVEQFILISEDVTDFSVSEMTVGFIKSNGRLYMYGNNAYGQLGTGDTVSKTEPESVLKNVTKVVCESTFTVALQKSGDVSVFGANTYGQFAKEGNEFHSPTEICENVKDISAGDDFILVLKNSGELYACGNNSNGQLGNQTNENSAEFIQILTGIKSIDAAKKSAIALSDSGELYSWGHNNVGQLGNNSETDSNIPTAVITNIASAATDGTHTIALTTDGKIISTGLNTYGQLGKGNERNSLSELVGIK